MRKRVFGKQFSRAQKGRRALRRSLVREFLLRGKITTTLTRAKVLSPIIDNLVILAKEKTVASRQALAAQIFHDKEATRKIIQSLPRFNQTNSGFTRISKIGKRRGDNAEMATFEWSKEMPQATSMESTKKS